MVWYSYLFKNFPQFVMIHKVKGFGMVNEEVEVFLKSPCFFYDSVDIGNLIFQCPWPLIHSFVKDFY